ncbi:MULTISPECIES: sulfotransferase family protein [Cyanophyceae]|uniref:sulfotransferase family protein n=2 Tax=Cyanophyceae TaxID=3028117 RepID=UPI00016DC8DE|nr:sulfotransferase [Picosynechococcus sp. PCC 7002]ACA99497.1 conserved hypothetical protein [Picosynechococcus sp. PCC 7002]
MFFISSKSIVFTNKYDTPTKLKMLDKFRDIISYSTARPIFIIGTGRSGTHWLGYSLENHPDIRATIEAKPMFNLSTRIALDPNLEEKLIGRLIRSYKWQILASYPRRYLDKTHPNIWIAEKLKRAFPNAVFIGIERSPYATVSSMMNHKGVSAWHQRWKNFPLPNRFLGITPELANIYDEIPMAAKCALRWSAHHEQMQKLKEILGENILVIHYENFVVNPQEVILKLERFLNLSRPIPMPNINVKSLDKWKKQLSTMEIEQVEAVVGLSP